MTIFVTTSWCKDDEIQNWIKIAKEKECPCLGCSLQRITEKEQTAPSPNFAKTEMERTSSITSVDFSSPTVGLALEKIIQNNEKKEETKEEKCSCWAGIEHRKNTANGHWKSIMQQIPKETEAHEPSKSEKETIKKLKKFVIHNIANREIAHLKKAIERIEQWFEPSFYSDSHCKETTLKVLTREVARLMIFLEEAK